MILSLVILLIFAGLLVAAAYEDAKRLVIPNRIVLAIALLFPAYALAAPDSVNLIGSLKIAAIVLAGGFLLFAFRFMGGGDAKLFAAASLWAGPHLFPLFLFVTAVTGAVIALAMLVSRRLAHWPAPVPETPAGGDPAVSSRPPADLPYGVAIAFGGIAVVVMTLIGE
jgi:prepilin peptidase CpaA